MILRIFIILLTILCMPLHAEENVTQKKENNKVTIDEFKAIKESLAKLIGADLVKNVKISSTPVSGIYETIIETNIFYFSKDGKYLLNEANIIELGESDSHNKNLTKLRLQDIRRDAIAKLEEKDMIVFNPKGEVKHTLNVFTDTDCHYCGVLHKEMDKLNNAGVKVRYLAFPRAGIGSETYNKMQSVWCAEDQQQAITDAKAGKSIPTKTCENPIDEQYELGKNLGVTGTPALIFSSGELFSGYAPTEKLVKYMEESEKQLKQ
jgi:thiol:disulfide interchange protein DsbC